MSWNVLYTKPRTEKKVAERLRDENLEIFCPLVKEVRQWSDRKKKVEIPLFNSYVFVKIKEKQRNVVFNCPGVVRYLYWLGKPAIVLDDEIDTIKKWLNNESYDSFKVENLNRGDRIKIKSGVFKDNEGIIEYVGNDHLKLLLSSLGCAVIVKLKELA
ncbi:Transcription antitermination factor NusG [Gillisia sp. Hel1_33_143]|uniref:UpxY family transcription antiterminator n=1 Tax=Gillisia sp. Hel1_33_143 TaxID=1336796 RepID=UPI00087ACE14|nr:UpxY family transcription antiterminator [Gillisia sp. Hel1_33_143]SDS33340.1 Transcription antitermination factor NusG [Gillisia sp. Hel1_33_143]